MRRSVAVFATLAVICLSPVADVLAGGGFGQAPPDRTVGPALNVSVVMDATVPPPTSDPTRQFAMTVTKGLHSHAAIFIGTRNYQYGCQQTGFPSLQASTEQRFLGFLNNWAPVDVLDAFIRPAGDPDLATIVEINDVSCTTIGVTEYLSFTGRIQFVRSP
jgi:hypothetical protein